jgi:hypothetical protein
LSHSFSTIGFACFNAVIIHFITPFSP